MLESKKEVIRSSFLVRFFVLTAILTLLSHIYPSVYAKEQLLSSSKSYVPHEERVKEKDMSKVKRFDYMPDTIFPLVLKVGYQLIVEFHPDEVIKTISSGNQYAWTMSIIGNKLLIKPLEEQIVTNAFVLTNERSYYFEVRSDPTIKDEDLDYLVKFNYDSNTRSAWKLPSFRKFFDDESRINYKYTYVAGKHIEPKKICDNGENTHISMSQNVDPYDLQVWVKGDDGVTLVPGYVDDDAIYISGVYNNITLMIKEHRIDIYRLQ